MYCICNCGHCEKGYCAKFDTAVSEALLLCPDALEYEEKSKIEETILDINCVSGDFPNDPVWKEPFAKSMIRRDRFYNERKIKESMKKKHDVESSWNIIKKEAINEETGKISIYYTRLSNNRKHQVLKKEAKSKSRKSSETANGSSYKKEYDIVFSEH